MNPLVLPEGTEASRRLCEEVSQQSGGCCLLAFSRGKDAIAAWLFLKRFFSRIIPFHQTIVPGLSFVDRSLDYYEEVFETPIVRLIDPNTLKYIADSLYQTPERRPLIVGSGLFGDYNRVDTAMILRREYGLPLDCGHAEGISIFDNAFRHAMYTAQWKRTGKPGRTANNRFFPCYDWPTSMIIEAIERAKIKLPDDYLMANRTVWNLVDGKHLVRMKELYPQDYEQIKRYFPLIEAKIKRNEYRQRQWEKRNSVSVSQDCQSR